uniref:Reverse transcriptase Ty1/copia-type domain-containing protein n=1 Tax=Solanum lycopersicum TaxID=4081 RepID=A0A3Q7J7V7_SOLLC
MKFDMKDLGPLHFFLGFEVNYFVGGIHLNQSKYVTELLAKTEMTFAKDVSTPLARKHGLLKLWEIFRESSNLTLTRPDITHAVNLASHFMQIPKIEHL